LNNAKAVFRDIPHIAVEFAELRLDIGYYLETARRLSHEFLCFLNTYTRLLTPNWLAHLYTHASRENVGIVGATASYESLFDSFGLYQKAIWATGQSGNGAGRCPTILPWTGIVGVAVLNTMSSSFPDVTITSGPVCTTSWASSPRRSS